MIDIKGLLLSSKKKYCIMHILQVIENNFLNVRNDPKKYRLSPDAIAQTSVILDLEGFSMNHITYKPGIVFQKCRRISLIKHSIYILLQFLCD